MLRIAFLVLYIKLIIPQNKWDNCACDIYWINNK